MDTTGALGRLWTASSRHKRRLTIWGVGLSLVLAFLVLQIIRPQISLFPETMASVTPGMTLIVFLLALLCEYIDSSLGMGYGTALTPLLLLFGFSPLQVVPCVLFSEFLTGMSAAALHQRDGNVDLFRDRQARSTAILLALLSGFGAFAAVAFAVRVPKSVLATVISCIILAVGILTLVTAGRQLRYRKGHIITLGTIAAFNKGLSGGGYGPLVTAGQVVSGLAPKKAVAVTSLAESITCFVGLIAYFMAGKHIDWALALPLTLGAMFSVPVATLTVKKIPERMFRIGVGVCTCILGLWALLKLM